MKLGILGAASIAVNRFMPAALEIEGLEVKCFASRNVDSEKSKIMKEKFGLICCENYDAILADSSIDSVYIPLPPALHYKWALKALQAGKHVFIEKPSVTNKKDLEHLIKEAREKDLVLYENYMFIHHNQLQELIDMASTEVGEIRLYRSTFSFPKRSEDDFRYKKDLGGGALLDAGGYVVKLASKLLGPTAKVSCAALSQPTGYDVDLYGSVTLTNANGVTYQGSFGMDNTYNCSFEVMGQNGEFKTDRIFTAPPGFKPSVFVKKNTPLNFEKKVELKEDDHFKKSILYFKSLINDKQMRLKEYDNMHQQICLIEDIKRS